MAVDSLRYSNNNNIKLKRTPVFEFAKCYRRTSKTYQATGDVMKSLTFNVSCDSTENNRTHCVTENSNEDRIEMYNLKNTERRDTILTKLL